MNDFRTRISSDAANDDWRHFEFVRRSGLRQSDFPEDPLLPDWVVAVIAIVCGLAAIAITWGQ